METNNSMNKEKTYNIISLLKNNLRLMKRYKNEVLKSFDCSKEELKKIDENLTKIGKLLHANFSKIESSLREEVHNEVEFYKKFFYKDQSRIKNINSKYSADTITMTNSEFQEFRKKKPLYRHIQFWSDLLIKKIEVLIQFFNNEVIEDNYNLDDDEIYSLIKEISNIYHRIILLRKARKHQYFFTGDVLRKIDIKD